jgi:hypothetical protein
VTSDDLATLRKKVSDAEGPSESLADEACRRFLELAAEDHTCPPYADLAPLIRRTLAEGSIDAVLSLAAMLMPDLDQHSYVLDPSSVNVYLVQGNIWKFDGSHRSSVALAFMDSLLFAEMCRLAEGERVGQLPDRPARYVPTQLVPDRL